MDTAEESALRRPHHAAGPRLGDCWPASGRTFRSCAPPWVISLSLKILAFESRGIPCDTCSKQVQPVPPPGSGFRGLSALLPTPRLGWSSAFGPGPSPRPIVLYPRQPGGMSYLARLEESSGRTGMKPAQLSDHKVCW